MKAIQRLVFVAAAAIFAAGTFSCAAGDSDWVSEELTKPVLGADAARSSWRTVFAEVKRADAECDAAWQRMKTREALQQYGKDLRSRMIRALGGFPSERCPLNARTVAVLKRDGYTVENVLFESWPGVHVSANLYLPDAARFSPPHPCVLISCGHSGAGKLAPYYSRGGVMSARAGIAALVVDPFTQGERVQERGKNPAVNWDEHNRIGSLAVLLGGGFPRFRVWDAMRALDYLETRPDIDSKALGCMGNSGGGNVTAFLQAVDPRLAATAPAGYVCSFSRAAEKATIGPGDACQNIYGQLSFGLNHASFCLMSAPLPVRVQAYHGDLVFPFEGTRHTVELVEGVMKRLGWGDRFGMTDMEGGHRWYEGSRASSIDWMKRWLRGDVAALARTTAEYRALNKGFDIKTADCGPDGPEGLSCGGGGVLSLPGERTVYDVMRDDLKAAISARKGTAEPADVRRIACIAEPGVVPLTRIEISDETRNGVRIVREAYVRPDGLKLPAVVFIPAKTSGAPVIALNAVSRRNSAAAVAKYVASGRPVMAIDLTGTGEIGQYGRKKGGGYYGRKGRDEELAVLLYALGTSLVGRQATELQEVALDVKRRFGTAPDIFTRGRMAVAAAHAVAVNRGLFGRVESIAPPPSWTESVEKSLDTPMSICVNGALLSYDWTELVPATGGSAVIRCSDGWRQCDGASAPQDIRFERVWEGRNVLDAALPFPEGVTFVPGAEYRAEVKSLPAGMRIVNEKGDTLAYFAAPTNVIPPFTMHVAVTGICRPAVFVTKDGKTTLDRIANLPKGFDPRHRKFMRTLSVKSDGGAGDVEARLSAGVGQADVRFVTRGREGRPYIEDGRLYFTFSVRFYAAMTGVGSLDAAHPERGVRFEGVLFYDYGDGLLRNDLAPHIFFDDVAGEWRGWACNFHKDKQTRGGVNAVWSKASPLHGLSVMKVKAAHLDGMGEDPCGVWDPDAKKWRMFVCRFTKKGIRGVTMESDRWEDGYKDVAGPVANDSTGTTIAWAGGTRYCLSGSSDRAYYVYSYPKLEMLGKLQMSPTPWGSAKGRPHGRGWPAFAELPDGYPHKYILLTMDRVNFPGMPKPNWTYGGLQIYVPAIR